MNIMNITEYSTENAVDGEHTRSIGTKNFYAGVVGGTVHQ